MAKTISVASFLGRVASEKSGFKFGPAERIAEDGLAAVVPILRKTSIKRQYVTFPETDKVAVKDTGSISAFEATNRSEENVFLRAGTLFKGATQERCLVRSAVLFPGKPVNLEVRCVHQSKGIRSGTQTSYGGVAPLELDQASYTPGYKPADQHTYWIGVQAYSMNVTGGKGMSAGQPTTRHPQESWMGHSFLRTSSLYEPVTANTFGTTERSAFGETVGEVRTSGGINMPGTKTDDLHSTINQFSANIDDVLKRVECKPNQVGLGIITDKGCQTIELFDVRESWSALHKDAVRRVGQDLSRKGPQVFDYKPEYATQTVAAVLADTYQENVILEHRPSNGEPPVRIIGLTSERFIGEVVEIEHRVVHVVLNRRL